jgi:hypothetical protein
MNMLRNRDSTKESFQMDTPKERQSGMYVSRSLAIILMVFFITILLTIGLLVGLLGRRTNTEKIIYVSEDKSTQNSETTTTTTIKTSITSQQPQNETTPDPFGIGPWQDIRLQKEIEPISYELHFFNIDYDNGVYEGNTIMKFELTMNSKYIIFHIKYLQIGTIKLIHQVNGEALLAKRFEYVKNQYYVLESNSEFSAGTYNLDVSFTGRTNIGIVGMYQSSYVEYGKTK